MAVFTQMLWRRRFSALWWGAGVAGLVALLAVAYPTVRDNSELDRTFSRLPPGVQAALGLDPGGSLTAPIGYLNSQYFANLLPAILLIFGIGLAAWSIAGEEAAGSLELLLANPVSRTRVALERAGGMVLLLAGLTAVSIVALALLGRPVGLTRGLGLDRIAAASLATALLALVFSSVAFALGAASGRRSLAISVAAALALAGFAIEGVAAQVRFLQPLRAASPWHWALGTEPLRQGLTWQSGLLPLGVSALLMGVGIALLSRRDLAL